MLQFSEMCVSEATVNNKNGFLLSEE